MLDSLQFWHWWVFAALLVVLEVSLSGAYFFLWLAAAGAAVGFLAMVPGVGWEAQFFAFGVLGILSLYLWRRFKPVAAETDQPALNQRAHRYLGRRFNLSQPIENGVGKLIVSDTTWRVTGPDLPAGTAVRVTQVDGVALRVEAALDSDDGPAGA